MNTCFTLENFNFFLLLSQFLANIGTANIDNVLSMLFSQCWSNANEHKFTQLSLLTKYQRWNNIGSSTMKRRTSFNVVSALFCQCWNNVDKDTSAPLLFSTKFRRWNNVGWLTLIRRNSIDIVSTMFGQRRNNVYKCKSAPLPCSTKFQVGTTLVHRRWFDVILSTLFQRCFANVETTLINVRQLNLHFQCWFNFDVFSGKHSIFHLFWS